VFLAFKELAVYRAAGTLSDEIRACLRTWQSLDVWTAGIQLLRSVDSVAANIAEGSGRRSTPVLRDGPSIPSRGPPLAHSCRRAKPEAATGRGRARRRNRSHAERSDRHYTAPSPDPN